MYQKTIEMLYIHHILYSKRGNTVSLATRCCVEIILKQFQVYICTFSAHVQGGPKKTSPYTVLFVLLQHLLRCTNNIPCELKFCCAHTEAQTKFVCQKFV